MYTSTVRICHGSVPSEASALLRSFEGKGTFEHRQSHSPWRPERREVQTWDDPFAKRGFRPKNIRINHGEQDFLWFFHIATGHWLFWVAKIESIHVGYMWDLIFSDFLGWWCGMFFLDETIINGYLNKVFHSSFGLELVVHNYWAARIMDFAALTCLQTWFLSRSLLGTWWFILHMASRLSAMGYGWRAIPPLCSLWFCKTYGKWPSST